MVRLVESSSKAEEDGQNAVAEAAEIVKHAVHEDKSDEAEDRFETRIQAEAEEVSSPGLALPSALQGLLKRA
jgi:hypothetical protein